MALKRIKLEPKDLEDEQEGESFHSNKMHPLPGNKANAMCYSFGGHLFQIARRKSGRIYLHCSLKLCPARLSHPDQYDKILDRDRCVMTGAHNHGPQPWILERNRLIHSLKHRVTTEQTKLREIYNEEACKFPLGAIHLPYPENTLRMWRRTIDQQATPSTLLDFGRQLQENGRMLPFYKATVHVRGHTAIIFCIQDFAAAIRKANYILLDKSFKKVPTSPPTTSLMSMHTFYGDNIEKAHMVMMALLDGETEALYARVLDWLRSSMPNATLSNTWLCDYDNSLRQAILTTFPQVTIRGCFYHYSQNLLKKATELGLTPLLQDGITVAVYRFLHCLALLPPEFMEVGLNTIKDLISEQGLTSIFQELMDYFDDVWMQEIGPMEFSVCDTPKHINDYGEVFFSSLLKRQRGSTTPSIWSFTSVIRLVFQTQETFLRKTTGTTRSLRSPTRFSSNDRKVRSAQLALRRQKCSVPDFLNAVVSITPEVIYSEDTPKLGPVPKFEMADYGSEYEDEAEAEEEEAEREEEEDEEAEHYIVRADDPVGTAAIETHSSELLFVCSVCEKSACNTLLRPCMHFVMCQDCAINILSKSQKCPSCDTLIEETIVGKFEPHCE